MNIKLWRYAGALLLAIGTSAGYAQQEMTPEQAAMMAAWEKAATPGEPHQHLQEAAGDWTATVQMWMEPGAEPAVSEASVTRQMTLDGRVLEEHWNGTFMGQPFKGVARTGYDNVTGKYWSTWTDNMSTALMVSHGEWDDAAKAYVFHGETTDPMTGGKISNRSVTTYPAEGKEVMEMYESHDGKEMLTMRIEMARK